MKRIEERWAVAALSGFAPESEGPREGLVTARPGSIDYRQTLRTMSGRSTILGRLGIRLAIWLIALSPIWSLRRLRLFPALEPAARADLLHRLLEHPLFAVRELCLLLKVVACMAFLAPGAVRAQTRFRDVDEDDPEKPEKAETGAALHAVGEELAS